MLFFDGQATPPQVAVYNTDGGTGAFQVQPAGTEIMGGANGGLFFDKAPGTASHTSGGVRVTVTKFVIDAKGGATDTVAAYDLGANGTKDSTVTLTLEVTRV